MLRPTILLLMVVTGVAVAEEVKPVEVKQPERIPLTDKEKISVKDFQIAMLQEQLKLLQTQNSIETINQNFSTFINSTKSNHKCDECTFDLPSLQLIKKSE